MASYFLSGYLISFGTLTFVALFEVWLDIFPKSQGSRIVLFAIAFLAVGCTGESEELVYQARSSFIYVTTHFPVQQSSFYGYTSMLPSRYTQAVMTGESK